MNVFNLNKKDCFVSENFYENIFNAIPCYVSVQDKELRVIASNKKFKNDFGGNIGSYCYEVYKHRNSPCIECPVLLTFNDGQSHSTEEVITTVYDEHRNVITWTSPVRNKDNYIVYVVEISTDITAIRKLQDRLTSLGLMISSVSHGLRGMLTAMDGGIYKLQTGIEKNNNERISSAFKQVKQTAKRIRKTILEILYYSKTRKFKYEKVRIDKFLSNFDNDFKETAESNNITFEVFNLTNLNYFEIDYNWMYIAISNFVENAIDACVADKRKINHYVRININKTNSNEITFLIQDNGVGMGHEVKDKLFTIFFSSKGSQGTGLGLFIANQVVTQHDGLVKVETNHLGGTIVTVSFPIKKII